MTDQIDGEAALESARLRLEPLTPRHAPSLFAALSDPRIYTYIPQDPPADLAWLAQRYQRLAARRSPDGAELWLNWAVRRQPQGEYIGVVQATVAAGLPAYLAYMFAPEFWGAGYAREACARVLDLLFGAGQIARAHAEVDTRNQASWGLLERLGFQRTAVRPAADFFKGGWSDEYTYELAAAAWRSRPR